MIKMSDELIKSLTHELIEERVKVRQLQEQIQKLKEELSEHTGKELELQAELNELKASIVPEPETESTTKTEKDW